MGDMVPKLGKENSSAPSSLYYWINKLRMDASEIPAPNYDIKELLKRKVLLAI